MKAEIFVISFKNSNDNSVKFAGLDSRDSFIKSDNPASLKKCFTREQATALARAIKTKGLDEGVSIRVKSLAQATRDYAWSLIQKVNETETVTPETLEKVLKRFEVKKAETKKEETPEAEVATETPEEN